MHQVYGIERALSGVRRSCSCAHLLSCVHASLGVACVWPTWDAAYIPYKLRFSCQLECRMDSIKNDSW